MSSAAALFPGCVRWEKCPEAGGREERTAAPLNRAAVQHQRVTSPVPQRQAGAHEAALIGLGELEQAPEAGIAQQLAPEYAAIPLKAAYPEQAQRQKKLA